MHTQTQTHPNSMAAGLGRRHSGLLHSILFGADLIQSGVDHQPYRHNDERSATYEAAADAVRNQADQLDNISAVLGRFENIQQIRDFFNGAHDDTLDRLEWSWNLAYDLLRLSNVKLPGKAARELDREPKDWFRTEPDSDIGARYADLTYWAVGALRALHVSALHPTRHKHNEEASLTKEIRYAKALLLAVETAGEILGHVDGARAGTVLAQYEAQTRLRTRMFADDTVQRLRPLR